VHDRDLEHLWMRGLFEEAAAIVAAGVSADNAASGT
jgi:hypothetical protein